MTDLLQDMIDYLVENSLASVTNSFRDTMPDTPDVAIALYEYGGDTPLPQIAGCDRRVQIVVRDNSATAAKLKAREIYNAFETDDGILDLTPERWCMLSLMQPPLRIKVDAKERVYYGFNAVLTTYND